LSWDKAREAVRAAWHRFDRNLDRYIGYDVVDRNGNGVGTLDCLWADHSGEPAFVGIRTGWFLGKTHVVPAQSVEVSERGQRLRLPYTQEKVKDAPTLDAESEMTSELENQVYGFYGLGHQTAGPGRERMPRQAGREEAHMQLSEEQLKIGKREVEAGGVRLRKIVRTEVVNQPVELRREEVVVERVPAGGMPRTGQVAFQQGDEIYIPLRREEAVIEKEARVREEVHARKESQTDTQRVSETLRKEDVEIERTGEAKEKGTRGQPPRKP